MRHLDNLVIQYDRSIILGLPGLLAEPEFKNLVFGYYKEIYDNYCQMPRTDITNSLIDYVERHYRTHELLKQIKKQNLFGFVPYENKLLKVIQQSDLAAGVHEILELEIPNLSAKLLDIDDKRIEACFSDSRPQFSQPDFKLVHDPGIYLFECINFLAKLNKECVQHFIDLLMERITPNEPNQDNQPKSCRLIIEITTEESTDKFNLRAWVKGSLDDGPLLDPQHSLDSNQASKKLEECVKKLANPPFGVKDVEIEFFLPVNLLSFYAADQLPFAELEGSDPLPIGYYHRVNVRILDIAWRDRKHGGTDAHTEGRWNKLHSSKTSKPCCCVKIPDAYQQNQLFAFLINDENKREEVLKKLIKHKEAIVCGVLSFAPSPMKNLEQACVINYLIARGVRVILWPRGTCKIKKGSLSNTLRKLVELDTLNQLSFNILKLRMDAVDKKKQNPRHVGSHLTLVWDDPTRPHPDNELQLRDSASSPADYSGERND